MKTKQKLQRQAILLTVLSALIAAAVIGVLAWQISSGRWSWKDQPLRGREPVSSLSETHSEEGK